MDDPHHTNTVNPPPATDPYHDLNRPPNTDTSTWLMTLLNPDPQTAIIMTLCILLLPLIGHYLFFRQRSPKTLPTILLLGPSSSGKTALLASFATPNTPQTRTSQTPLTLPASIPSTLAASSKYRSSSDPSLSASHKFLLRDTPGHGKLRGEALSHLSDPDTLAAVFLVDSSAPAIELVGAAEYLHAALLEVQRMKAKQGGDDVFRFLVACNKSDLFTALPPGKMKIVLEEEVGKVREARSRGVVGVGEEEKEETDEWLGEVGADWFEFSQLEDAGIEVEFLGGTVKDDGWRQKLSTWIGKSL